MSRPLRLALIPGSPALLAKNASLDDPIVELRAACRAAVGWLVEPGLPILVRGSGHGAEVARQLIAEAGGVLAGRGFETAVNGLLNQQPLGGQPLGQQPRVVLVVGNGSACRTEKAPGFFDPRAAAYDEALGTALEGPDRIALANLDRTLGRELLADIESLRWLGSEVLTAAHRPTVLYDDDPFGVQYWVMSWELSDGD